MPHFIFNKMLENLREKLTENLCTRDDLIGWLSQIIRDNNQVNFKLQEANPSNWWLRATISRFERNQRRVSCWESKNYTLNQFLQKLIIALSEKNPQK